MRSSAIEADQLLELDLLIDDVVDEMEADYARSGGHMPGEPLRGRSGMWQQAAMWTRVVRQLGQWGIPVAQSRQARRRDARASELRTEQPQVIGHRRWPGSERRGMTTTNHPDIQAVDPRSGRRINIEVDSTRNEPKLRRQLRRIARNDPQARVAGVLTDPVTGAAVRTHVYDPLTRRWTYHRGGLLRRDVLDLDD